MPALICQIGWTKFLKNSKRHYTTPRFWTCKQTTKATFECSDEDLDELASIVAATPIEFKLPAMPEWLVPRCYNFLDHDTTDLGDAEFFNGAESQENYDDLTSFFAEFNAANDGFKEAQNAERVPTMETHGYVLEES